MKRAVIALGIIWVAALHGIAALAFFAPHLLPDQSWRLGLNPPEPTAYVAERHRYLVNLDAQGEPGGIVLIGTSHLEGLDPALLGRPVRNYAIGTDTLRNIAARVGDYRNLGNARAIVLHGGYNDIKYRNVDAIVADYGAVLATLPPETPIISLPLLPVADEGLRSTITAINAGIAQRCEADARCTFVDWTERLVDADGGLSPALERGDGVHLNRAGYRALAAGLRPALEALAPRQ